MTRVDTIETAVSMETVDAWGVDLDTIRAAVEDRLRELWPEAAVSVFDEWSYGAIVHPTAAYDRDGNELLDIVYMIDLDIVPQVLASLVD